MKVIRTILRLLIRDTTGSGSVDFAFALPVLVTIMLGALQMGQVLHASGALRHALGQGVRYAKVNPTATEAQVVAEVKDELAAVDPDGITKLKFTRGTTNGAKWGTAEISYKMEPMIPLVPVPPIELNESKTIWLPS